MKISSVPVSDLVGRTCENANGAQFRIKDARYDLKHDCVTFWLAEIDAHGVEEEEPSGGILSFAGWTIH